MSIHILLFIFFKIILAHNGNARIIIINDVKF